VAGANDFFRGHAVDMGALVHHGRHPRRLQPARRSGFQCCT
jgi:hypothetical protein